MTDVIRQVSSLSATCLQGPKTFASAGPRSVVSVDDSLGDDMPSSPRATGDAPAVTQKAVQRLTHQVARLKASRDKLLSQVDGQSGELERLHVSNTVLEQVETSNSLKIGVQNLQLHASHRALEHLGCGMECCWVACPLSAPRLLFCMPASIECRTCRAPACSLLPSCATVILCVSKDHLGLTAVPAKCRAYRTCGAWRSLGSARHRRPWPQWSVSRACWPRALSGLPSRALRALRSVSAWPVCVSVRLSLG